MRELAPTDRKVIVVGRSLPFSVYAADRTLLLAAGKVVANDYVREGLLRAGLYCSDDAHAVDARAVSKPRMSAPLEVLRDDYRDTWTRSQVGFRMQRDGEAEVYTARPVGVTETGAIVMSGPFTMDGQKIPVIEGSSWTFRALYAVSALKFDAEVFTSGTRSKECFYAEKIHGVERRDVRKWPRVPTCMEAWREGEPQRMIVDFSVGGARVAADHRTALERGQDILLNPSVMLLGREHPLTLEAVVVNLYGAADTKHPDVRFYGVRFERLAEPDRVLLHAYVQETLCLDLDRVSHLFSINSL